MIMLNFGIFPRDLKTFESKVLGSQTLSEKIEILEIQPKKGDF